MYSIDTMTSLNLGEQGEHLANEIRVDMSPWVDEDNTLRFYIVALRHAETNPYIPATTMEDNILVWPVTSADTAITGAGLTQFVATDGTRIVKSKRIRTSVGTVIPGSEEDEAPEPIQGWIDSMLAQVSADRVAAETARTEAVAAQAAAEAAQELAVPAAEAAQAAQEAAESARNLAQGYRDEAEAFATRAETAADMALDTHGIFWLEMDENENVWYYRVGATGLDFVIDEQEVLYAYVRD